MFRKKTAPPWVSAIIAAGGASTRMEGIDKQSVFIDGVPVVAHSVRALMSCALIREVVLVCPGNQVGHYYDMVNEYDLHLVSQVIGGGKTRQASVFSGIEACSGQAEYFAIHDGARPLVTPQEVSACVAAAIEQGAAALGVKPKDTLKRMDAQGCIAGTINREDTVAIHTPQVFAAKIYRQAMALARCEGRDYSDDCQLVERLGNRVQVVCGSYENIKITTPQDIIIARALLQGVEEW